MKKKYDLSAEEVENIFAKFGKTVWPYFVSFAEIHHEYEEKMLEKIVRQRLEADLKDKYFLLKELGVNYEDIFSGTALSILESEERKKIGDLLLDIKEDIKKFVFQTILHKEEKKYRQKIETYRQKMIEMEKLISDLRQLADNCQFEDLVAEIKDKIRAIENSLIFLETKIDLNNLEKIKDYYLGKIEEKKYR